MKRLLCIFLVIALIIYAFSAPAFAIRDVSYEEKLAEELKALGLFRGVSDTNFDLERPPTRIEALVMLIRLLGVEDTALSKSWEHPFTDVPAWADRYIGYAYQKGLTNGISSDQFGTGNANVAMYLTFVLRALGYLDQNGLDFTWDDPFYLAALVGALNTHVNTDSFWRADAVIISHAALKSELKGGELTLADKLISLGVFNRTLFNSVYGAASSGALRAALTSEQVFAQCSPAVFCIRTYDAQRQPLMLGSGFFLDPSGVAVTNYHVLQDACFATATLTDGTTREISGVITYDAAQDYALIKVDGSGFASLSIGNSDALKGGESIYTIGNPEGLTNTISNGLVSNPKREDYNDMIQISAPISPGSSGGALINAYGEVIGITTSALISGQNLNFAVPIGKIMNGKSSTEFLNGRTIKSMADFYSETHSAELTHEEAFNALRRFIDNNYNNTYGTDKAFIYMDYENKISYSIDYTEALDSLTLFCGFFYDYNEDSAIFLYIGKESTELSLSYAYYVDGEESNHGWSTFDAADCAENMIVSFSEYNGTGRYRLNDEAIASTMVPAAITFLKTVFDYGISDYDVTDLGFIHF